MFIYNFYFTIYRQIEYIYHGWKSRSANVSEEKRYKHYKQMLYEDADAGMLKMFEAFLEAAPQLVLQMFIILTETSDDGDFMSKNINDFSTVRLSF